MSRVDFNADLQVRQQYLSMVSARFPGGASWTLLDQGKVMSPSAAAEEQKYNRIGDQNSTVIGGQVETDVTVQIYVENNLSEIALILGQERPGGGWVGTEVIQLDPTVVVDLKIENFDGVDVGADLLFTEYVNAFRPLNFGIPEDADGDARIAELSGKAASYYIMPEAGT